MTTKDKASKLVEFIRKLSDFSRLLDFLKQSGIEVSGYDEAKEIINMAADIMVVPRSYLDQSIWDYMGKGSSPVCK